MSFISTSGDKSHMQLNLDPVFWFFFCGEVGHNGWTVQGPSWCHCFCQTCFSSHEMRVIILRHRWLSKWDNIHFHSCSHVALTIASSFSSDDQTVENNKGLLMFSYIQSYKKTLLLPPASHIVTSDRKEKLHRPSGSYYMGWLVWQKNVLVTL